MVFTVAMGAAGVLAVPIAAYEGNVGSVIGGILVVYFVYTAMTTVKPMPGSGGGMRLSRATVCLLAAIGDARTIRAGGLRGPRRLARHLWRMCFALFIATGSFFIGQMKFVPAPIRFVPLLFALGVAPLFVLLYWMWRVRLRRRLTGVIIASSQTMNEGIHAS